MFLLGSMTYAEAQRPGRAGVEFDSEARRAGRSPSEKGRGQGARG